ncbi:MAG: DUF2304 domain-containing protein [Actinobacteria bacterium]|nr:DUF2304 domain-containing protein [Actinomycetota bacterium]
MSTRAHIALAVLVALAIFVIIRLVRRRHLKAKYSLLWLTLGGFMVVIAAVPGLLDWTAARLGIYYEPTLLILLGLALLLLIVMHFSYELSRMENRVRTLAEESAILRHRVAALESGGSPSNGTDGTDAPGTAPDGTGAIGP